MSDRDSQSRPPQKIANGRFEIEKKLGAGCFGEVWRGVDVTTKTQVAVKCEDCSGTALQLEHEAEILKLLCRPTQPQGFAQCYHFGVEGRFHCMVMELLGKSLEACFQSCNSSFTVKTTVLLADQVLRRIEFIHSKGIVHRDIKPENFMLGVRDKVHHLYLIDFGLSKKYFDQKHVQPRTKLSLTGTARYASVNAHNGKEQSRRDDLEATAHMLIYFLRGSLPWSGLDARTQEEKYRKIRDTKEKCNLDELCKGFPDAFKLYLKEARELEFKERPDYNGFRKLFRDVRDSLEGPVEDHHLQWLDGKDLGPLSPIGPWKPILQPDDEVPKRRVGCFFCGTKNQAD